MKFITIGNGEVRKEPLIQDEHINVIHLHLNQGEMIPVHPTGSHVVIVIVKGKINFSNGEHTEEIYPGKVVYMEPGDLHGLTALEDSDVIVNHYR